MAPRNGAWISLPVSLSATFSHTVELTSSHAAFVSTAQISVLGFPQRLLVHPSYVSFQLLREHEELTLL